MTHDPSRRDFLAAAAAAATLSAWQDVSAARAATSANERVGLAIVGVNSRGAQLATSLANVPGATVRYLCDPDSNALAACQGVVTQYQDAPQLVPDFRTALEDPSVDAVLISTPDHWHAPAALLACAAGKHVYVEKPCCHNGHEGQLLIAAAEKYGLQMQMGNQRRSSAGHQEVIQRLQQGELGRVLFARGWINSQRPSIGHGNEAQPPANLDYSLWQGPAPELPYRDNVIHYHWHWFWHWGTGELGNNGIHALDICRWGLGVEYPLRTVCGGGKYHFDDDQETPDTQLATFDFGHCAIHWEHRTWHPRGLENDAFGIVFYGEQGSLVITGGKYVIYDLENREVAQGSTGYSNEAHLSNFCAAIRSGEPLFSPIAEGVKSTTLCLLGNIAYRTGRTVNFDPATRQIVDDAEAAALWTREYRPGWEPQV